MPMPTLLLMTANGLVLRHFLLKLRNQGPGYGQFVGPVLIGHITCVVHMQYIGRGAQGVGDAVGVVGTALVAVFYPRVTGLTHVLRTVHPFLRRAEVESINGFRERHS